MVSGVFMIVFGLLAVFSPAATGAAVVNIIALVLLVAGIVRLVQAYRSRGRVDTMMSAILGAVFAGLGVLVWLNPEIGFRISDGAVDGVFCRTWPVENIHGIAL